MEKANKKISIKISVTDVQVKEIVGLVAINNLVPFVMKEVPMGAVANDHEARSSKMASIGIS